MNKSLDEVLDECIDRLNAGESLDECLASYPGHAEELAPLLRAVTDARQAYSPVPRAAARLRARHRLNAAVVETNSQRPRHSWGPASLFGGRRLWVATSIVIVLALVATALRAVFVPGDAEPALAQANFHLLLSDEENAISDFDSLLVTVTGFGVLRGGEGGSWEEITLDDPVVVDLTQLSGLNAQEIWNGDLPEGQYRRVFIHVESAVGTVDGEPVDVKVPSGNLQVSKPFAIVEGDTEVNFVYDITVIAAGNEHSGITYILLPQVDESGADQEFHEVGEGRLTLQVIGGTVAPGETITLLVTYQGDAVADAAVEVNDEPAGTTDAGGQVMLVVPYEKKLDIEAISGEMKGKLKIRLGKRLTIQLSEFSEGLAGQGADVTLLVTFEGYPVPDALVEVNDEPVGATDADGFISFLVPYDKELEIEATRDGLKGKLKLKFQNKFSLQIVSDERTVTVTFPLDEDGDDEELLGRLRGEAERDDEHGQMKLTMEIVEGEAVPGGTIIVVVRLGDIPAVGALVTVDDVEIGTTDEDGRITVTVPDEDELELEAVQGRRKAKLEIGLDEDNGEHHEGRLSVEVVEGEVVPGGSVTVLVTFDGNVVPDATVEVNGDDLGTTDADGRIIFVVPDDEELEVEVRLGGLEGKLKIRLDGEGEGYQHGDQEEHQEGELSVGVIEGTVAPGETVTVLVASDGNVVPDATVEVNGDDLGTTDADGRFTFIVTDDDELEVEVRLGDLKGKLKIEFDDD